MAKHELRIRSIIDGPPDLDPADVVEKVEAGFPAATVHLDNHLIAKLAEELSKEEMDAILKGSE